METNVLVNENNNEVKSSRIRMIIFAVATIAIFMFWGMRVYAEEGVDRTKCQYQIYSDWLTNLSSFKNLVGGSPVGAVETEAILHANEKYMWFYGKVEPVKSM